jgi:rSAM/selenodomain-associated transferase 1
MTTLGLFVKHPVPGRVKTRLSAELGAGRTAAIYAAFVADLVERFRDVAERRVLCFAPATDNARDYFASIGGMDYELWPQPEVDLGARMARFFAEHLVEPHDRVLLIGSDSPTLPREHVERAFALLQDVDCVVGPAMDGGYYLIGQSGACRPIFDGVAWSTSRVLEQTVARVTECGARLAVLPPWYDVDTPQDWQFLVGHLQALERANSPSVESALSRWLRVDTAAPSDPL